MFAWCHCLCARTGQQRTAHQQFCFEGFCPEKGRSNHKLKKTAEESYHGRFMKACGWLKTLSEMIQYFGRQAVLYRRELTQKFEENKEALLQEVRDYFAAKPVKGEIVIVVEGRAD